MTPPAIAERKTVNEFEDNSSSAPIDGARTINRTEMLRWLHRLADLPDIRMTKVTRLRRAIHLHDYDESELLDKALPGLESDLEALCRQSTLAK